MVEQKNAPPLPQSNITFSTCLHSLRISLAMSNKATKRTSFGLGRRSSSAQNEPQASTPSTSRSQSVFSRWRRNEKPEASKIALPPTIPPLNLTDDSVKTSPVAAAQKSPGDVAVDTAQAGQVTAPISVSAGAPLTPSSTQEGRQLSPKQSIPRKTSESPAKRASAASPITPKPTSPSARSNQSNNVGVATPKSGFLSSSVIPSTAIFREVKSSSTATASAVQRKKLEKSPNDLTSPTSLASTSAHPVVTSAITNEPRVVIPLSAVKTDFNGIVIRVTTPASAQSSKSALLLNGGNPISLSTTLHQLKLDIAELLELEDVQLFPQKQLNPLKPCNCAFAESVARNGLWEMLRCRDHTRIACDYAHPDPPVLRKGTCPLCLLDLVERCGDCQDAGIVNRDGCPLVVNAGCNHTFHHHCYTKQFSDTCPAGCSTGRLPWLFILTC